MPINFDSNVFMPHIRWMARDGVWKLSTSDSGDFIDMSWDKCLFDIENLKMGWAVFQEGFAPAFAWGASITEPIDKPADGRDWKRAFSVNIFSPQSFGGDGLREFTSNTNGATRGIQMLYNDHYEPSKVMGQIPVVQFAGSEVNKYSGKSDSHVPILKIEKYVARPPEMEQAILHYLNGTQRAVATQPVIQAPVMPAPAVSHVVQPPVALAPAPAPQVVESESEF
mgnify:FL=1